MGKSLIAVPLLASLVLLVGAPLPARAQSTTQASVLYRFNGKDGTGPSALIQGASGNFYGVTQYGGANNLGTVFSLTPGGGLTTLHSFASGEGTVPSSLIQDSDGTLFGTTGYGGAGRQGTVFKLDADGTLTTLFGFTATDNHAVNADGALPVSLILGGDGKLYGVTSTGGANGGGTVFKVTRAGVLTTLASFATPVVPPGGIAGIPLHVTLTQGQDGNLYGTTNLGGPDSEGIVFSITPDGVLTVLHSFSALDAQYTNGDGAVPLSALVQGGDGKLYGTTSGGGANNAGTFFSITPAGEFTNLHDFAAYDGGSFNATNTEGISPQKLIQGNDGNFYGITAGGGPNGNGTIFAVTPAGELTVVYSFDISTDGGYSLNTFLQSRSGYFFGTTSNGGSNGFFGQGTVLALSLASPTLPLVTLATSTPVIPVGGTGGFTVSLAPGPASKVLVHYAIKGSAVNGTDYTLLSGTVKLKPGKTSKTVTVSPLGSLDGLTKKTIKLSLYADPGYTVGTTQPVKIKLVQP